MKTTTKQMLGAAATCVASLVGAVFFCLSCSNHEWNRQGQSQDSVTHLLATGTYLSLAVGVAAGALFVALLIASLQKPK